jgi:hypothetical protein
LKEVKAIVAAQAEHEALNVLEAPPLSEEVIDEELEKLGWSEVPTDVGDGEAPVA